MMGHSSLHPNTLPEGVQVTVVQDFLLNSIWINIKFDLGHITVVWLGYKGSERH